MLLDLFSQLDYNAKKMKIFKSLVVWLVGLLWVAGGGYYWVVGGGGVSFMRLVVAHFSNVYSGVFKLLSTFYSLMAGVFIIILFSKLWGLVPYVFGGTSQVVVSMSLAFGLWLSVNLSSVFYKTNSYFSHFTPSGCPLALVSMLKFIELVSNLMRPLTLSLRLAMNLSTGHILLGLVGGGGVVSFGGSGLFFVCLFMVGYMFFEVGICLVQSFVFTLLVVQYAEEHTA